MTEGFLLVDKPVGFTSHDIVALVRRALGERRVGHSGTLDPAATGLLVLGVGRSTRLLTFLVGADKRYEAVIRLGMARPARMAMIAMTMSNSSRVNPSERFMNDSHRRLCPACHPNPSVGPGKWAQPDPVSILVSAGSERDL